MSEFIVNNKCFEVETGRIADDIEQIVSAGGQAKVVVTKKSNGTIPMLRLWKMWMKDLAEYMSKKGRSMP
ncbi:MAG: hypothetical protein ACPG5L_16175, partial [Vibrio gallaecicus]